MSYIDTIVDDMALFHDAPCDVLAAISGWGSGAYYPDSYSQPSGWTNGLMWFHMMEDLSTASLSASDAVRPWRVAGPYTGNTSTNTRIQARDLQLWFLKADGTWQLHGHSVSPGSYMVPITWGNESGAKSNTFWRVESSANGGGASIKDLGKSPYEDYVWHAFTSPRNPLPSGYVGIASCFYARLLIDDPDGVDDRSSCRILAAGAGDYYESQAVADGSVPKTVGGNVSAMGYSRLKYVTNNWQLFAFYSKRTLTESQIRANPPPFIGLGILDEQPGPEPEVPVFTPLSLPSRGSWFAKTTSAMNTWTTHAVANTAANKIRRRRGVKLWS